jgi:hypothetical protein
MPCSMITLPDGTIAIVKHAKARFPRCRFCPVDHLHQACDATLLCDFVVGKTLAGAEITCDAPVCTHCAKHVGTDKDFCPKHSK